MSITKTRLTRPPRFSLSSRLVLSSLPFYSLSLLSLFSLHFSILSPLPSLSLPSFLVCSARFFPFFLSLSFMARNSRSFLSHPSRAPSTCFPSFDDCECVFEDESVIWLDSQLKVNRVCLGLNLPMVSTVCHYLHTSYYYISSCSTLVIISSRRCVESSSFSHSSLSLHTLLVSGKIRWWGRECMTNPLWVHEKQSLLTHSKNKCSPSFP